MMKLSAAALLAIAGSAVADDGHWTTIPTIHPSWTVSNPYRETSNDTPLLTLPQHPHPDKYTTSTIYATTTRTIVSCHPTVTLCPSHSTVVTTITVPVSTTICPVTTELPPPPPPSTGSAPPPPPPPQPSVSLTLGSPSEYPTAAPSTGSLVPPPPPPPASSSEVAPPVIIPTGTSVGTIGAPSPTSSGFAEITAGAAQNVQRAGGALAAVALAAAALI